VLYVLIRLEPTYSKVRFDPNVLGVMVGVDGGDGDDADMTYEYSGKTTFLSVSCCCVKPHK